MPTKDDLLLQLERLQRHLDLMGVLGDRLADALDGYVCEEVAEVKIDVAAWRHLREREKVKV